MSFVSVNELEKFSYGDCKVLEFKQDGSKLVFELEALIVNPNNSQNSNYTESYADEAKMVLEGAVVGAAIEEGYKVFDANDKPIREVPDKEIPTEEVISLLSGLDEAYLCSVEIITKTETASKYAFEIETGSINEIGMTDPYSPTYLVQIQFEKATVSWERYLNKVQR